MVDSLEAKAPILGAELIDGLNDGKVRLDTLSTRESGD